MLTLKSIDVIRMTMKLHKIHYVHLHPLPLSHSLFFFSKNAYEMNLILVFPKIHSEVIIAQYLIFFIE